jgi:hypothetical protein
MHARIALLALLLAFAASCKSVDCGDGTTERDGLCVAAGVTIGNATCGPFTQLQGTQCVPMLPPTVCDPGSTDQEVDNMGVTTCIGNGAGGGCSARLACAAPSNGTQTICGQIYDFETDEPFAAPDATGDECPEGITSGPCALGIRAFDAVAFANTNGMAPPLTTGPVYIDDCGRYRVSEIAQPGASPFIALGFDDRAGTPGPSGVTNAVGIATGVGPNTATRDLDGFIVRGATAAAWAGTGGPSLAAGIFAPVYRPSRAGRELAAGVTFTFGQMTAPPTYPTMTNMGRDYYFASGATTRMNLDPAANVTGANGTALVSGASLAEVYSGAGGGLPATCLWDVHAGAAVSGVVFVQIFRPMNFPGMTCPL